MKSIVNSREKLLPNCKNTWSERNSAWQEWSQLSVITVKNEIFEMYTNNNKINTTKPYVLQCNSIKCQQQTRITYSNHITYGYFTTSKDQCIP